MPKPRITITELRHLFNTAHYKTKMGEVVVGLARDTDGRWRIMATGQRFTEPDECKAVEKFRDLTYQPNSQQAHVAKIMDNKNQS